MKTRLASFVLFGLVVAGFLFLFISRPSALPLDDKASSGILRVCVSNIYYKNPLADDLTESLIKTRSDIFFISEWQGENLKLDVFQANGYDIPLNHPANGTHGMALIVKKELGIHAELIKSPITGPCSMPIVTSRVKYKSKNLALLGIHVPPPIPSCNNTTNPTLSVIRKWVKNGDLNGKIGVGVVGDPVIVAGDFNAFSFNKEVSAFADSALFDTYSVANSRYGPTWSPFSWVPSVFRIDYIFASHRFGVAASHTIKLPGSDHRGIVSDIDLQASSRLSK